MTAAYGPAPLYRANGIRALEEAARRAAPGVDLMRRAGEAAAALAYRLADGGGVLVLAGPGNNGGDGFVAARELARRGCAVTCVFAGDAGRLPEDAARALAQWRAAGGGTTELWPDGGDFALVVDALFGMGLARDLSGPPLELVRKANACRVPVLSLDVPSGLDADTGAVRGEAVRAAATITFLAAKPGLFTGAGPDHAGRVTTDSLGFDPRALLSAHGETLVRASVTGLLPPRQRDSHKGAHGSVAIVGGAPGMLGAALLAGRAALHCGAGKVYVGALQASEPPIDPAAPELMWRPAQEAAALADLTTLAVGPGLGRQSSAHDLVRAAIATSVALVVDADALNLVAEDAALARALGERAAPTAITPHPAEAGRLLNTSARAVQSDRIEACVELASRFRCEVVLKGAGSVCAGPDGAWRINTSGNPGLAAGGMGDVLTGMVAAFMAQRLTARSALALAVHLHGAAADALVERGTGPVGLTASEVSIEARELLNRWVYRPDSL